MMKVNKVKVKFCYIDVVKFYTIWSHSWLKSFALHEYRRCLFLAIAWFTWSLIEFRVKRPSFLGEILINLQNPRNLRKPCIQNVPIWTYGFQTISESHIFLEGYCYIDFFNFWHCQVWNLQILNQCERD
jgi:hypothetical protein